MLELVIVFSLLMTLLALVTMYFVKGRHYVADTEAYSSLQREGSQALRRIKEQLERSTMLHMTPHAQESPATEPSHVYFLSFHSDDSPGVVFGGLNGSQVFWKRWLCFFHVPENEQVFQAEVPLSPPTFDIVTKPAPDVNYASFQGAKQKMVGSRISELSFRKLGQSLLVSLEVRGLSPVPMRLEEDKIINIQLNVQVAVTN